MKKIDSQSRLYKYSIIIAFSAMINACGGSGSGGGAGTGTTLPEITIDNPVVTEANSDGVILSFSASLNKTDSADVNVDFSTADDTATAGSDYVALSGTLTIPAGSTSATIDVVINGDTDVEGDETFSINFSNVSANATLLTVSAIGTIINDDSTVIPPTSSLSSLNDTGVITCSDNAVNGLNCNDSGDGTDQFVGQDAEHGRDVLYNNDSDGHAGFIFSKLDNNGDPLADQSADYATTPWSCVEDEVTGLTWEVKTDDDGLQDKDWTYSWYDSRGIGNISSPGVIDGGQCEEARSCDTQTLIVEINDAQLCGFGDWRLPTRRELISIIHFGVSAAPYIDTEFFTNHASMPYWSSTTSAVGSGNTAYVNFSEYGASTSSNDNAFSVRLVRGGE